MGARYTRELLERQPARHGTSTTRSGGAEDAIFRQQPTGTPRTRTEVLRRALGDLSEPRVRAKCGLGDTWQGKRLVLEIHVSGDRWDNRRENLRYLCPSCHSQTRTHSRPGRVRAARDQ